MWDDPWLDGTAGFASCPPEVWFIRLCPAAFLSSLQYKCWPVLTAWLCHVCRARTRDLFPVRQIIPHLICWHELFFSSWHVDNEVKFAWYISLSFWFLHPSYFLCCTLYIRWCPQCTNYQFVFEILHMHIDWLLENLFLGCQRSFFTVVLSLLWLK